MNQSLIFFSFLFVVPHTDSPIMQEIFDFSECFQCYFLKDKPESLVMFWPSVSLKESVKFFQLDFDST